MKVQASGVGIRIASNIRYNIPERWIEGFAENYQGLAIEGKSTKLLPEQVQGIQRGFDLNDKIRLTVKFTHDLKALTSARSSQPTIRLVDYVGFATTTPNLGGYSGKSNTFSKTT